MEGLVLMLMGAGYYIATRYREGLDALYRGEELLDRAGDRWESNMAGCNIAYCLYRLGNLKAATETGKRVAQEAFAIGNYVPGASALSCWAKASGGKIPDETIAFALSKTADLDVQSSVEIKQAAAVWHLGRGENEAAVKILRNACSQFRAKHLTQEYVISSIPWLLTALRVSIEKTPAEQSARRREIEKEAWKVYRSGIRIMKRFKANLPHIYREAGLLEALNPKRGDRARELFQKSLAEAERQEAVFSAAQTRMAIGKVGRARGWPDADDMIARATSEFEHLGADSSYREI
jgi:hypothetical protein